MSSPNKEWIVAASIGTVEALKDQSIYRWNYALGSLQQHAKSNIQSHPQANRSLSSNSSGNSTSASEKIRDNERVKLSEEALRTIMYLSCWGPNN